MPPEQDEFRCRAWGIFKSYLSKGMQQKTCQLIPALFGHMYYVPMYLINKKTLEVPFLDVRWQCLQADKKTVFGRLGSLLLGVFGFPTPKTVYSPEN